LSLLSVVSGDSFLVSVLQLIVVNVSREINTGFIMWLGVLQNQNLN